jgi:hypothetical protein
MRLPSLESSSDFFFVDVDSLFLSKEVEEVEGDVAVVVLFVVVGLLSQTSESLSLEMLRFLGEVVDEDSW